MKCLVFVKFLPGGSISPDQFFAHLDAEWGWYDENEEMTEMGNENDTRPEVRSAVCVTDYDSIQQLAIDISIMPGAGIAGIEVVPVSELDMETNYISSLSATSIYN
ncbi:MAG: hypothetical protein JW712_09385 [Dehalococcoidales bacterium]|nr:hypothetical protein [Dehalococcoidales bacterium]